MQISSQEAPIKFTKEKESCLNELKDSLIILTFTHALLKDSINNINYFYTNHENILKTRLSLKKIQELFIKILPKNSTTCSTDFLLFFKEKIRINESFNANNQTLWQICFSKKFSFLEDLLKVFSQEIELTLTEKDVASNESFLLNAAKLNNKEFVKLLLKCPKIDLSSLNINRRFYEYRGDNILTWATNNGQLGILKLLYQKFPKTLDINQTNGLSENCLIIAAKKGFEKIVDFIIENFNEKLFFNQKDANEDTAFIKALENGKFEICDKILQSFKNPLILYIRKNGISVLETLVIKYLPESLKYLIELLRESQEFREQMVDNMLEKALGLAILKENWGIVKDIIEKLGDFIDLMYVNHEGKSFLSFAVENESNQILAFLLKSQIDFKQMILKPDKTGETPLSLAIRSNKFENCLFLIEKLQKDDLLNLKQNSKAFEETLLLLTQKSQWSLVQDLFLQKLILYIPPLSSKQDNNNTILHYIARGGQISLFKYLYANYESDIKAIINCQNSDLETALTVSSRFSRWDLVEFLLEIPGVNYLTKDSSNRSFLCYVFSEGDEEFIMRILHKMKKLVDVNYSFIGLIKKKLWKKVVFLMKKGIVDGNLFDSESQKSSISLFVELMDIGEERVIEEIFEVFDFEHQEIINVKKTIIILIQKNALNLLRIFLKKLKFHDFLNQDFLEISEQLAQIQDPALFNEIFVKILNMIEASGLNAIEINEWNDELLRLLPYKPGDLEAWSKRSPFKLNISHRFNEFQGLNLLEIVIKKRFEESLKILLDFCEDSGIYLSNMEGLMLKSLKEKQENIAKILMSDRLFDLTYKDSDGNPLIYSLVMENNLSLLQVCIDKLKNLDQFYLNKFGESAIILAAQRNFCDILKYFLDNLELNFSSKNHEGRSFLYYMAMNQCFDYLAYLHEVQNSVLPLLDEKDSAGNTPFLALAKNHKWEECKNLIEFTKKINRNGVSTINIWQVNKEHKGVMDFIHGDLNSNSDLKLFELFRSYGALEFRSKLIENEEIKKALNNGESTQMGNVDRTIKESIQRLKARFPLTPEQILAENAKVKGFFTHLITFSPTDNISEELLKNIDYALYSANKLKYKGIQIKDVTAIEFVTIAQSQIIKMQCDTTYLHCSALITNQELIALIWKAIYDTEDFSSNLKNELIMQRQAIFIRHLFEAFKDGICSRGQFNKTLECLNYSHVDIQIDMLDFTNNHIVIINKEAINSVWKKLCLCCLEELSKEMQNKLKEMMFFWGELEICERQAILGGFKEVFRANFKKFFPYVKYDEPKNEDYVLLEDILGIYHQKQIIDFVSCLE